MTWNDLVSVAPEGELVDLISGLRTLASQLENVATFGPAGVQADVIISDWVVAKRTVPILVGRMKGHPMIKNGHVGATTELFYTDRNAGLVRTFNRWYRLGPSMITGRMQ